MIPDEIHDLTTYYKNLAIQYSDISIEKIRYFKNNHVNAPERAKQEFHMMYKFITNFLSEEAKTKVNVWSEEYYIVPLQSIKILLKAEIR